MLKKEDLKGSNSKIIIAGVIVEFVGLMWVFLLLIWTSAFLNGPSLIGSNQEKINFHAVFMPFSLVFLEGNGIIIYRLLKGYQSRDVKYLHYGIQTLALFLGFLAYFAMFFAREKHVSRYYSLHSWLGLIIIFIFLVEFFGGIFLFSSTKVTPKVLELSAAFHAFFGLFNCILGIWVACLGISTLATRTILNFTDFTVPGVLANFSGLIMILFGALVFFICTYPDFEWDKVEAAETQMALKMKSQNKFVISIAVSHALGLGFIILLFIWSVNHLEGLSCENDPQKMNNLHMMVSVISYYITGTSMTIFRVLTGYLTSRVKYIHAALHCASLVLLIFGFYLSVSSRNLQHIPHFYSLHSWIALAMVIFLAIQYICSIYFFIIKESNTSLGEDYATVHAFCGLFGFLLSGVIANIGIIEKAFFSVLTYAALTESTYVANFAGLFIATFGALTFFICVNPYFEWDRIVLVT